MNKEAAAVKLARELGIDAVHSWGKPTPGVELIERFFQAAYDAGAAAERKRWQDVENYLIKASKGSMSRNDSEAIAGHLLGKIRRARSSEACAKNIGDTTAAWTPIEQPYPLEGKLDILMGDGSILCGVIPQEEGDLWWSGTAEKFIDPQYYDITHWRIHCDTAAIRARGNT